METRELAVAGYEAELLTDNAAHGGRVLADEPTPMRREAWRAGVACALAVPLLAPLAGVPLPGWLELALAVPVQVLIGARFYVGAWRALRSLSANMDLLVALGTSGAFGFSVYGFLAVPLGAQLYFDASAVVIALVAVGQWLEARAKRSSAGAMRALFALRAERACVERDGKQIDVPLDAVAVDDRVVVRPGERFAVDGVVLSGSSTADERSLRGESPPVAKGPGDFVIGGSINGTGRLRIATTAVGERSMLGRIVALVARARSDRSPAPRLVDRVAAWFVPSVLCVALGALGGWWLLGGDLPAGLLTAAAVLVIACPSGLGLVAPMALMAGAGAAARAGVRIRDAQALGLVRRLDTMVLDGSIAESDAARPTIRAAIQRLHALGIHTVLLTAGDDHAAAAVAEQLGVRRVVAGALPAQNVAEIRRLQAEGRCVGMVGVGAYDAPALAAADVGLAIESATGAALQTAGITLEHFDPVQLSDVIAVSRATYQNAKQGLFWAFVYNVVILPVAALGLLSPVVVGGALALSCVSVVCNALRLRSWQSASRPRERASSAR